MQVYDYHPLVNLIYFFVVAFSVLSFNHPVLLCCSFFCMLANLIYLQGKKGLLGFVIGSLIGVFVNLVFVLTNHFGDMVILGEIGDNPFTVEVLLAGTVIGIKIVVAAMAFILFLDIITIDKILALLGGIFPRITTYLIIILKTIKETKINWNQTKRSKQSMKKMNFKGMAFGIINKTIDNLMEKSESIKARGYGSAKRRGYAYYEFNNIDRIALILFVSIGMMLCICLAGGMFYARYNPVITIASCTNASFLILAFYTIFLLFPTLSGIYFNTLYKY